MRDDQYLDGALCSLASQAQSEMPADFMDGVWQRAGQLGEIADQRRRLALFAGLLVVGLGAGVGTNELPYPYGATTQQTGGSFMAGEQLSPAALLHVGR